MKHNLTLINKKTNLTLKQSYAVTSLSKIESYRLNDLHRLFIDSVLRNATLRKVKGD